MFYNCINNLKLSILYNKKGFIVKNNKNNINLLKNLIKINLIKFIKIENSIIYVYINYINNKPIFKFIVNLFKPGHKIYISLKNLKKISYKNNWILILSTNKGLLNNFDAIQKKTGGLLLAKIWN